MNTNGARMGNNCANCLILRGDQDVLAEVEEMILNENCEIDFSKIIPLDEVTDRKAAPKVKNIYAIFGAANAMRTQRFVLEDRIRYDFDTVLLPPVTWIDELADLFPAIDIAMAWCEPAFDNLGQIVIRAGCSPERFDASYRGTYDLEPPNVQRKMPKPRQAMEDDHKWRAFELWEGGDPFALSEL